MKVLMFGWEFPPHISGGLGTACAGITDGLAANDVQVIFVVPRHYGNEDTKSIRLISAGDTPVHDEKAISGRLKRMLVRYEINSPLTPYINAAQFRTETVSEDAAQDPMQLASPIRYAFSGGYGKDLMKEVWQYAITAEVIAKEQSFDIIHANDWLTFPAAILASEASGKPLVVHVHATEFDRSGTNINTQVYETERLGMQKADHIIAVSEFTRQIIITRYHIPAEKISVVHNGVAWDNRTTVKKSDRVFREPTVVFAGRITYQKGPAAFVEAAARILKTNSNFRFIMAGSGDLMHDMINRAAQLRISSHFHFTGFLHKQELEKLLSQADVYVMPSVSEPFGISPLEAVSNGVPVVISRQSGVQEVLQHALKMDHWDLDALANNIYGLASYKGISRLLSRESRREVDALTWEKQSGLILHIYQSILNH